MTVWAEINRDPFIFVTVGTDHHPFHRLMKWTDNWADRGRGPRLIAQSGTSSPPSRVASLPYLEYEDVVAAFHQSVGVVCQGGPATIMEIRRSGKVPIVVPRRVALGEHVNDHQWLFCRRLAAKDQIVICDSEDHFVSALERLVDDPDSFTLEDEADSEVEQAVRAFGALVDPLIERHRAKRGSGR